MAKRRRRMTAKQRKFFGKRRHRKAAKVVVVSSNPRRHRRRSRRSVFSTNPRRHRARRFRRNPITRGPGLMNNALIPGAIGAAGAMGTDWLLRNFGQVIPFQFRGPQMMPFVRVGVSLGVGALVSAMGGSEEAAAEAAAGGVVVALYGLGNQMFGASFGLGRYLKGAPNQRQRLAALGYQRLRRLNGMGKAVAHAAAVQRARLHGLGAGNPNNVTKFRILRDGQTMGNRLGYMGPVRTLGRYLQH